MSTMPEEHTRARMVRARLIAAVWITILAIFVTAGLAGFFGVRTGIASATSGGFRLEVEYPRITRSALPMTWQLTLSREGGFDDRVRIATTIGYFELFDLSWLHPAPAEERSAGGRTVWIYDPPPGDSLVLLLDGRMGPGLETGRTANTAVSIDGTRLVDVTYETIVWP
jgi:hypothetical protein